MPKTFLNVLLSTIALATVACSETPDAASNIESSAGSGQPNSSGQPSNSGQPNSSGQPGSGASQAQSGAGPQSTPDANAPGNTSTGDSTSPGDPGNPATNATSSGTPGAMVGLGGSSNASASGGNAGAGASENGGSAQGGNAFGGTVGGLAGLGGSESAGGGVPGAGGTSGDGSSGGANEPGPSTFHVFLLLGQSNMAGYSRAEAEDKVEDERIQVLGFDNCSATGRAADEWDVAVPPLHECGPGALGPGDYFAKTLIEKLPEGDTIGLVPCALSGQAVEVFSKGTDEYDWIIERAENAQQLGGVIAGLLFHQGESNCGNSAWPAAVQQLVEDLRADLTLGDDVPFLAGELPHESACGNHNPLVNQLPDRITNAHVVSAEGLELDPADTAWYMHFGRDAQVEFGERYEAKFVEVTGL